MPPPPSKKQKREASLLTDPNKEPDIQFNSLQVGSLQELAALYNPKTYLPKAMWKKASAGADSPRSKPKKPSPKPKGKGRRPKAKAGKKRGRQSGGGDSSSGGETETDSDVSDSDDSTSDSSDDSASTTSTAPPPPRAIRKAVMPAVKDPRVPFLPPEGYEIKGTVKGSRGRATLRLREATTEARSGEGHERFHCLFKSCFLKPMHRVIGEVLRRKPDGDAVLNFAGSQTIGIYAPVNHLDFSFIPLDPTQPTDGAESQGVVWNRCSRTGEEEALLGAVSYRLHRFGRRTSPMTLLEVLFIAVAAPFQRLGLGTLLLSAVMELGTNMEGCDRVVVSSSEDATPFYLARGYRPIPPDDGASERCLRMHRTSQLHCLIEAEGVTDCWGIDRAGRGFTSKAGLKAVEVDGMEDLKSCDAMEVNQKIRENRRRAPAKKQGAKPAPEKQE